MKGSKVVITVCMQAEQVRDTQRGAGTAALEAAKQEVWALECIQMPDFGTVPSNPEELVIYCLDNVTLLLVLLLKCADLSHAAAPLALHLAWVRRLEEEVWCQGDLEAELGTPPSGPFDRAHMGLQQTQVRVSRRMRVAHMHGSRLAIASTNRLR